jgi:hypothetical protein
MLGHLIQDLLDLRSQFQYLQHVTLDAFQSFFLDAVVGFANVFFYGGDEVNLTPPSGVTQFVCSTYIAALGAQWQIMIPPG